MKITNDDIISAAKSLREKQDQKLTTPQNPLTAKRSNKIWMAAAACAVGFIFGFGLRPSMMPFADGSHTAQQLTADSLQQVLSSLAPPLRMLFSLRYEEDLTVPQIAKIQELPEGTVKSRLHKTMTIIRNKLKEYEDN